MKLSAPSPQKSLSGNAERELPFALVDARYFADRLAQEDRADQVILLEAHFSSVDHPLDPAMPVFPHIPGAIQVHPSYLEAGINRHKYYPFYDHPTESNVMSGADLGSALERLGLTPDSQVVVYGSDPDGVMAAARLCWGLMYAGIRQVRLLDGGIDAWLAYGGRSCLDIKSVWDTDPSFFKPAAWSLRPEYLATMEEVGRLTGEDRTCETGKLIDVRTEAEWHGTSSKKYPFFSRAGHIPGAIHQGDWDNLMHRGTKSLAPHLQVVASRWRLQGIIDEGVEAGTTSLTFYCGTGWRSSIAFLVAHLLGLRAKNFDDGFYGWSHYPDHPIVLKNGPP